MKVRSPAWIIVAGVVLVQASGAMSTVGNLLVGIDSTIKATVDIKGFIAKAIAPKPQFVPIKKVVIPPRQMPTKAPVKQ